MAHNLLVAAALGTLMAASPAAANQQADAAAGAPPGNPGTEYCMWVEPVTGSRLETVQCFTREQWADQGVDLDKDWPKEGVAVQEPGVRRQVTG